MAGKRSTKAEMEIRRQRIMELAEEGAPQSVRHIFYRMTEPGPGQVEKTDSGYEKVQRLVAELRTEGRMPFSWIADNSRTYYGYEGADSLESFAAETAALYRRDYWRESGYLVEAWCESRAMAGVLSQECRRLGVNLYPSGGFSSFSFLWAAAGHITRAARPDTVILYAGDYDPAGVLIDVDIESKLRDYLGRQGYGGDLHFARLAVTPEQIAAWRLPTKPRKATDKRSLHITEAVEAESIPARTARQLFRDAAEYLLPDGWIAAEKLAEQSERRDIRAVLEDLAYERGADQC